MSSGLSGSVPGDGRMDQAIRLAGALAELGEHRIVLHHPDGRQEPLAPRSTDLPGLFLAASSGVRIVCGDLGLTISIQDMAVRWEAQSPAAAATIRTALGAP
jgi:hypothetical protein